VSTIVEVTDPNLTALLARAVATGVGRSGDTLPDTVVVRRDVRLDPAAVAAYAQVCQFPVGDTLPTTYLHMLAFPLSVHAMADRSFPFPLIGMVHVRNRITHHRPVGIDEVVDLEVSLADLRPHPKGRQFDVVADARVANEVVWSSTSTYLRRGKANGEAADDHHPADDVDVAALPMTAQWKVPADIGRRYGAVSGDRNPIHLFGLTAKAFGFNRAIAHGMWSKARCLAALEGRLPDAHQVDVAFKLPIMLPSTVEYATQAVGDDWQFALRGRSRDDSPGKPHLAGVVRPA
jgi:acyl dehydratase